MDVAIVDALVYLNPVINFITAVAALGSVILLAVNAFLVYWYVQETRKQAEATYNIMKFNRAEFTPNVQVLFDVEEREIDGDIYRGLFCSKDGDLKIPVNYINLSKGVSEFTLNFQYFPTAISTFAGNIRFNVPSINMGEKMGPTILKRAEKFQWFIIFDLKDAFDKSELDFNALYVLKNSDFSVCYRIEYGDEKEPFSEIWHMSINGLKDLGSPGWLLLGDWSTMYRRRFKKGD